MSRLTPENAQAVRDQFGPIRETCPPYGPNARPVHYPSCGLALRDLEIALGQKTKKAICGKRVIYEDTALFNISCPGCRNALLEERQSIMALTGHIDQAIIDRAIAEIDKALAGGLS